MAGATPFLGRSAAIASVVIRSDATEARILQRDADHLGQVDNAGRDHVDILLGLGIEAVIARLLQHLADHDRAFDTGVLGDLPDR